MAHHFIYEKANGDLSERIVIPIGFDFNHDNILAIDLTEFDEEEKIYYETALEAARDAFNKAIRDAGLGHNYRNFKVSRIK